MENKIKNKKIFWLIITLAAILLATGARFIFMAKNINNSTVVGYVIPNVPYFGIYNHRGSVASVSGYRGGDSCTSVLEILEFWNPGQNHFKFTCDGLGKKTPDDFIRLFSEKNFSAKMSELTISDLKKYINSEVRTPLILFLPISADQPDSIRYSPATVLIGIDENSQKLTMHSYWLGNNYEISFNEFNKLENKLPIDQRNKYLIVQPNNLDEKLKELSQKKAESYPARTSIMQNGEQMFKDYAIGAGAYTNSLWPQALEYLSKVENSPNFDNFFPPYLKIMLYYQKAKILFMKNDLDNALVYAQKSVAINSDLDKPFKDWPGYETSYVRPDKRGIAPEPYIILGDILDKKDDLANALDAYKRASSILLNSADVSASIINLKLEMAKKGIAAE